MKKDWTARIGYLTAKLTHTWEGDTFTVVARYTVCVNAYVTQDNKDNGRRLLVDLTADEARALAENLNQMADRVDAANANR